MNMNGICAIQQLTYLFVYRNITQLTVVKRYSISSGERQNRVVNKQH